MPSHLIVVAAMGALFGLLSRLSPYRPPNRTYPPHAELQKRFYWMPIPLSLPIFALLALWTVAEGRYLIYSHQSKLAIGPGELALLPDNSCWYVVSALGGLWFAMDGGFWLIRRILGNQYDEYIHWNLTNTRFDSRPFLRSLGIATAVASIWLSIECGRVFFRLNGQQGSWRTFRGAEVQFSCADIAEVISAEGAIAPNGDFAIGRDVGIELRTGERWHSRATLIHHPDEEEDQLFAAKLASRCSLPVTPAKIVR